MRAQARSDDAGSAHRFVPSGRRMSGALRPHTRGQRPELCAAPGCDQPRTDPAHRSPAGRWPAIRPERAPAPAGQERRRAPRRALRPPACRELVMLAYAIDEVLEIDESEIGWRETLRARELRSALAYIPRADGALRRSATEVSPAGSGGEEPARQDRPVTHHAPADPEPLVPIQLEHVPPSDRARARSQAKAISDKACRELATRAIAAGWQLKRGSNHWILYRPNVPGRLTLPSDVQGYWRGWRNVRASAKRLGIDVEGL